jgi:2-ketoarginine methyltransferase
MLELLKATGRFGLPYMLRLRSSYKVAWKDVFRGYVTTTGLHALLNVGFLDELERQGSVDIDAFATERDLDIRVLRPVCEAFQSMRILRRNGECYYLRRPQAETLAAIRGWLEVSWGYSEIFHSLEDLMRGDKKYGTDFSRRSDYVARGSGEMEKWLYFPLINDIIRERRYKTILDLGCGDGTFLRNLCTINKEVRCFGIDLAQSAIDEGRCKAIVAGLQRRLTLYAQDIAEIGGVAGPALRGVDVATAFFVLHELLYHGKTVLLKFLGDFRRVFPNVPLIAVETIRPTPEAMAKREGLAIYYFLYHDLSQQRPVDRETWKALFKEAGFEYIEERNLPFVRSAIYLLR